MKKIIIRKKTIIIFILAIVVFSNSYLIAKYTSSLNGSNSSANLAKWNVSYDTTDNASDTLQLISGNETKSYTIKVTNSSDVAADYSIVLSNVPSEMEVKIDERPYQTPTNNRIVFDDIGTFSGNDMNTTFTHALTFNAPLESTIASSTNVRIDIEFNQIN